MQRRVSVIVLVVVALALAACGSDEADRNVTTGDELLRVTFDDPAAWETGRYPAAPEAPVTQLAIEDGRYVVDFFAERSASVTWGLGGEAYEDVVIDVVTEQLSGVDDNLYGVACRMAEGDRGFMQGYVLLISGDGYYGIADLSRNSLDFLLEWHQSDAIKQGAASNTIRAVCVDDYLAVYANGEFLGDVTDDQYAGAGQVALVVGVAEDESVQIAFDDLVVYEGTISAD